MSSTAASCILIVDDEPDNRALLEIVLEGEGFLTRSAASGEEALASVAREAPDLIVLDVMMPGMNGYQVTTALKLNPATSGIPVLILSAFTDRAAARRATESGADAFLGKPVDRALLCARIRTLLAPSRA
jgi:CheY-like chemotaxis protein